MDQPTVAPALLPAFDVVARRRPVTLARSGTPVAGAPCAAVEADLASPDAQTWLGLASGGVELRAHREDGRVRLELERDGRTTRHESRRYARAPRSEGLALTLTGDLATAWSRDGSRWTARAILRLDEDHHPGLEGPDVHDEAWLGGLRATGDVSRAGRFGQVGFRDPRLVPPADGTPSRAAGGTGGGTGPLLLCLTAAGPGGFGTGHTSVWSLDPVSHELRHRSDLFFRRPGTGPRAAAGTGVHGDHATQLVRVDDHWLVATSTWGDFDDRTNPRVSMTLSRSTADLLHGSHVLDSTPLAAPTTGLTSVGTWDPHLVRTDDGWLAAYVSASEFFVFHPVVATGPDLDSLTLRAAADRRTSCEGPTLLRTEAGWRVLASHGRDGRRDREGRPATYPVMDLDLRELGTLDARYPTNLPWPTVAPHDGGWLMVGFDGTPYGGPLLGYGTHGDLVVQRG